ncbi:MAG: hypothetical protein JJU36_09390 [Phycisphaeraceae bacterium]|nr:hypothetical protein [Phycisphaeraceae bacterium]
MKRSDRDLAIDAAKSLESALERLLGARGRGLHEKINSVEDRLPEGWVRRARFIATMRNKLLHDERTTRLDDRRGFSRAAEQCRRELDRIARSGGSHSASRVNRRALLLAFAALIALLITLGLFVRII